MAETLPTPSNWRRFRHRQAWLAVIFLLPAVVGLVAVLGGVWPGLILVLLFGPLGLLCVLNARTGRRGGRAARLVPRDGVAQLEFPSHRLATVMVLLLAAACLAGLVALVLLYAWEGLHGSIGAAVAAAFFAAITGYGVYISWLGGEGGGWRPHRGWPAVRLGAEGVELAGPLGGWFMPWDVCPVPVPRAGGELRLVPLPALHELSQPLPEGRLQRLMALPGSIPPTTIDADLTVVAATVFFYGQHPERRAELTSPPGVERVHRGELPKPWPDDL
jgi:hypothetical protein